MLNKKVASFFLGLGALAVLGAGSVEDEASQLPIDHPTIGKQTLRLH